MKNSSLLVIFQLALVISCVYADSSIAHDSAIFPNQQSWCVVTVGAPNDRLQAFLDSACGQLDCRAVRPGGSCFNPNTIQNHASYVLNLNYRARGDCVSGLGTPTINDPSFGSCRYT